MIYKNTLSNYFVWFFAVGPGIVNGIAHFVFPIIAGAFYFPGLITVLLPFIVGILLIVKLVSGYRSEAAPKATIEKSAG